MLFFFFQQTMRQKFRIMRIAQYFQAKILIFQFIKLASFLFFFYTKLSILKLKRKHGKHSCAELCGKKWQNKSEKGAFFLFQAVFGYISSNHNTCYMKELVHRSQRPVAQKIDLQMLFATKQWPFAAKMYYIKGQKFPCIFKVCTKRSL